MRLANSSGVLINSGSSRVSVTDFADCGVAWSNSYDAVNATFYTPSPSEQSEYGISSTDRVAGTSDPSGNMPLYRDAGPFGQAWGRTNGLPGPKWIASSKRFRGRPAFKFDQVYNSPIPLYSMLSPQLAIANSAQYFNTPNGYAAPYWCAALCRLQVAPGGLVDSVLGSDPSISAGPTVGYGNQIGTSGVDWSFACWYDPSGSLIPDGTVRSGHTQSLNETVLIICDVTRGTDAATMWVYWKTANRTLSNVQVDGTIAATAPTTAWRDLFFGWIAPHSYLSAFGIKSGTITLGDIGNVINWASPWMPSTATLPAEP